jgi:ABC-type Zn2+ transport system substrate-binding protein/surface adhesin
MRTAPLLLTGLLALTLGTPALAHKAHSHAHADETTHSDHSHGKSHDHNHDHGHDSLSAHQHGVAQLNVVVDGASVEIELNSPADNLVGFEYLPTSAEDQAKVRAVREQLQDGGNLFRFPQAAQCSARQADLSSPLFDALEEKKEKAHEHGHAHQHDKHDHGHDKSAHNDIEAQYRFECGNPAALNQIEVLLFTQFPATERLILQAVGNAGQQGGELTPAQNLIRF